MLVTRGPSTAFAKAIRDKARRRSPTAGIRWSSGFAKSLARPGLNMTGITFMALELSAKRVEVLKELVPAATRLGVADQPGAFR